MKRLLGVSGDMGAKMGVDNDAFKRAIAAVGNYGEIFARNIGEGTADQPGPRPERAVDPGRPAVRTAASVDLSKGRGGAKRRPRVPFKR